MVQINLHTGQGRWSLFTNRYELSYFQRGYYAPILPKGDGINDLEQLVKAIGYSRLYLKAQAWDRIKELTSKESLAMLGVFASVWVGSQFTPVGWAADALVLVMTIGGCILLGPHLLEVGSLLASFYKKATNAGRNEAQYRSAGEDFAGVVTLLGVDVLMVLVFHVAKAPVNRLVVRVKQGGVGRLPGSGPTPLQADPPRGNMTNAQKGVYGEHVSDVHMQNQGHTKLNDGGTITSSTGAARGTGIDGVWRNATPPPDYIITEAKYGSSRSGQTQDGRQMSDEWVLGSDRLERATGSRQQAADIQDAMARGQVEKQLHHIDEHGNITVQILDEDGNVVR